MNNRFKGEVSPEEQAIAQQHPAVQEMLARQAAKQAEQQAAEAEAAVAEQPAEAAAETPAAPEAE